MSHLTFLKSESIPFVHEQVTFAYQLFPSSLFLHTIRGQVLGHLKVCNDRFTNTRPAFPR